MNLFTVGFKGKTAEEFFSTLKRVGVEKLIDVRRSNSSQLAGFTKGRDLAFFLQTCFSIEYEHIADFAPSQEVLAEYRSKLGHKKKNDAAWETYVRRYAQELAQRPVAELFRKATEGVSNVCFLCSEENADRCHRRLLAEHIAQALGNVEIKHLE